VLDSYHFYLSHQEGNPTSVMSATDEALAALRREMQPLLETAMENVLTKVGGVLEEAEQQRAQGIADVAHEGTCRGGRGACLSAR
jgi:Fe-S cluster biogenesis protein NfuA